MLDSRSLEDLLPCVHSRAVAFIALAEKEIPGLKIIVTCTFRDAEKQDLLYSYGRRNIPGERIVTNARGWDSFHQYKVAFDIFPILDGKPILFLEDGNEVADPIWQKLGIIAETCGLEWAGRWKTFKEGPHFQYTGGLTLESLRQGNVPN